MNVPTCFYDQTTPITRTAIALLACNNDCAESPGFTNLLREIEPLPVGWTCGQAAVLLLQRRLAYLESL